MLLLYREDESSMLVQRVSNYQSAQYNIPGDLFLILLIFHLSKDILRNFVPYPPTSSQYIWSIASSVILFKSSNNAWACFSCLNMFLCVVKNRMLHSHGTTLICFTFIHEICDLRMCGLVSILLLPRLILLEHIYTIFPAS